MLSARRQPGLDQGAALALNLSGGLARAETASVARPVEPVNDLDPSELSPEELARLSAQGSLAAFEQIVLRFQSQIFNFLHLFTRHRQDAEDLTQETFCRAWRGLHRYNPSLSFAPWLFSIARHTAASHFRSAETFDELPPDTGVIEENPASVLATKDDADTLWRLARTLKHRHGEVLWFRYGEGFSIAETARAMRTNQIHVKVLLHRARASLAGRLAASELTPAKAMKLQPPKTQTVPEPER
jgi:RNA polymerase sigma-70 factor (ECF subfamily)